MRDMIVVIGLSSSVALALTAYVATLYGLVVRAEWRYFLISMVAPPFAVVAALRTGMRFRALSVLVGAVAYLLFGVLALAG